MLTKSNLKKELAFLKKLNSIYRANCHFPSCVPVYTKLQHGKHRLFIKLNDKERYISKKDLQLLAQIYANNISHKIISHIEANIDILNYVNSNYTFAEDFSDKLNINHFAQTVSSVFPKNCSEFSDGIYGFLPQNKSSDSLTLEWLNAPTTYSNFMLENKIFKTPAGVLVRSKSELLIASLLESKNIAYKYEARLLLNERFVYPDFTIMHPRTHDIIILEHFGMMHDDEYRTKNNLKISDYLNAGYRLGDNFIATYDDINGAIDMSALSRIIDAYLM